MRQLHILLVTVCWLSVCGLALADNSLSLTGSIGFDGYYRPNTLVPITVNITNAGDTLRGEFRVTSQSERVFSGSYITPVTIPRGANQRKFLYVMPNMFAKDITVEFWSRGIKVAEVPMPNCQELYDTGRLLVVVGGSGASFNFMGSLPIHPTRTSATPRPWDFTSQLRAQSSPYLRSIPAPQGINSNNQNNTQNNGILSIAYLDPRTLPDNPEAYGSIAMLALMSDTTENTLPAGAQEAIPQWVNSGGHLLIAGGGVPARLQAHFFAGLLPSPQVSTTTRVNGTGGMAITRRLGTGYVTALSYDPDSESQANTASFYQPLFTMDPDTPATLLLHQTIDTAVGVRNLQPPNLSLIIIYLLVYLIMLVPINYFVLKKIDKREMAWITTPIIVLFFTFGAYGIGYAMKGHRLVLNQISVVETSAGQSAAEAVSEWLIFSPSRSTYALDLGDNGLFAQEVNREDSNSAYGGYPQEPLAAPCTYFDNNGKPEVHDIGVNMWDYSQFALAHSVNLHGGFTAQLTAGQPGAAPRATGSVTNNTPFHFVHCELYADGALVAQFPMAPQQTVKIDKATPPAAPPVFTPDGTQLVTAYTSKKIVRWNLSTNKIAGTLQAALQPCEINMALSGDGQHLAIGSSDTLMLWDFAQGRISAQHPLAYHTTPGKMVASLDGSRVLATIPDDATHRFVAWNTGTDAFSEKDVVSGQQSVANHRKHYFAAAFSPTGTYAVANSPKDNILTCWKTGGWKYYHAITLGKIEALDYVFSHTGQKLAISSVTRYRSPGAFQLSLYQLPGGQRLNQLNVQGTPLTFSADDQTLFWAGYRDHGLTLLQLASTTGVIEHEFPFPPAWRPDMDQLQFIPNTEYDRIAPEITQYNTIENLNYDPAREHLIGISSIPARLVDWDVKQDSIKQIPLTGVPNLCRLSSGGLLLTGNSADGTLDLWDLNQVLSEAAPFPRARLYTFANGGWLAATPDGYFDCSPEILKAIAWRQDGQLYPGEKYARQYHQPEIVRKALSGL